MTTPAIKRSLKAIQGELEFLKEVKFLTAEESASIETLLSSKAQPQQRETIVRAIYEYKSGIPDNLALNRGDCILVLSEVDSNWSRGRNISTGQEGIYPLTYVRPEMDSDPPPYGMKDASDAEKSTATETSDASKSYYGAKDYVSNAGKAYGAKDSTSDAGKSYYGAKDYAQAAMSQLKIGNSEKRPEPETSPKPVAVQGPYYGHAHMQQQPMQQQTQQPHYGQNLVVNQDMGQAKEFGTKVAGQFGNAAIFGAGASLGANLMNNLF